MKKGWMLILVTMVISPLVINAADRVVVIEMGTGTWCGHCPDAAQKARELTFEHPGEVLLVEYHRDDNFTNLDAFDRIMFYEIVYYPDAIFDGLTSLVGDDEHTLSLYDSTFDQRKAVDSPLEITLERTFDPENDEGSVSATIINTSEDTVSGTVQFTLTESAIYYPWPDAFPTEDSLHFVNRDMMPSSDGEPLTLGPGEEKVLEREFALDPEWYETTGLAENFELGCFVQANDPEHHEIYQAALLPVWVPFDCEYVQSRLDNADGMLHPGETTDYQVTILNTGDEAWTSLSGILSSNDDQITIPDDTCSWGTCQPGEEVTNTDDAFGIRLRTDGEEGHRPMLTLTVVDDEGNEVEIEHRLPEPLGISGDEAVFALQVPSMISETGAIALSLSLSSRIEMVLIDACGRKIKTLYHGDAPPGKIIVPFSSRDFPEGVYFVKTIIGDRVRTDKLLIIR